MSKQSKSKYPVLSFFTGGGFLDMGFEETGFFDVIWTNEINPVVAEMYAAGYSAWNKSRGVKKEVEISFKGSFDAFTPEEIITKAFKDDVPEKFGIIGGPPCQDFSSSGKNAGFKGERGKLTKVFFEYIKTLAPSFFVVENVKNLNNQNSHSKGLKRILAKLKKDYFIDVKVLNAIHYGVPQDRNRLFIIGIKKPEAFKSGFMDYEFSFPDPPIEPAYQNALRKYKWPDVDDFQNGVVAPTDIPESLYVNHYLLKKEEESNVPNGDEYFKPYSPKFWDIKEGDTKRRSFKRLHRYRFSPTACYGNNEVHLHPFLPRRLSVREVLRLQSVPDTYVLPKHISLTQKFKMIGNAVPFQLGHAVAETMKKFLQNFDRNASL